MVVQSSEGVRDVQSVVDRVDLAVEEGDHVECSVHEVLPCVDAEAAGSELVTMEKEDHTYNPKSILAQGMSHQYVNLTMSAPCLRNNDSPAL